MTLPDSFWVSMIVRNMKPGPPESDNCVPPAPEANSASVPANRARLVAASLVVSNAIFRSGVEVFVSTGIPVTRYFPLLPTVPSYWKIMAFAFSSY